MASFSSDYKLSDVQLCEGNACNRWWLKALFSVPGSRSSQRCPHCRGAPTEPTKYWHGGRSGPKAPSYDYPGYLSPQSIKRPDQSGAKRSTPIDTTMATQSANKKHKLQQPTPTTPTGKVEFPRSDRKDSLQSPATPKPDPALQTLLSKTSNLYEAWRNCDGRTETHLQSELAAAEVNVQKMTTSLPKIERKVKENQSQLSIAQVTLERMETMWTEINESARKAGLDEEKHKANKEQWLQGAQKHVQLAFEDNNRKSREYQKGMEDLASAKQLIVDMKQRVVDIEEERKRLKAFGEFFCVELPSKNSA
ncbi:hypothetical protein D6C93_08469 [Aureobasidium pullulans]|uniref:Uncharacterized protein n=1 Tax=Aureobasidium pullulans TaxID=5580 RepID=A0A4S8W981_AURPU|nr:hypothetical protein D6D24_01999 [Aureobasidium pullulans]THY84646.1 hypothetical protein D6C93_08469 [Aureobasidium pullulans]